MAEDVEDEEVVRDVGRRELIGVRGLERLGSVVDRDIEEMGDGRFVGFPEAKPARCRSIDWPDDLESGLRLGIIVAVVEVEGVDSMTGDKSDS